MKCLIFILFQFTLHITPCCVYIFWRGRYFGKKMSMKTKKRSFPETRSLPIRYVDLLHDMDFMPDLAMNRKILVRLIINLIVP